MDSEFDAVVIGAGVAGSSIAYSLSKQGWKVALVDRETYPRHKACGEFLSPESVSSLKAIGLDKVVASCNPRPSRQYVCIRNAEHRSKFHYPDPPWA